MMAGCVAELLTDLRRRGVELRADGDRLLYRPRTAVPPNVLDQLRAHKAEVLAILADNATDFDFGHSAVTDGELPGPTEPVPRELSFQERVKSGYINPGWTATGWAVRLEYLADRCQEYHPTHASELRRWAANVRDRHERKGDGR